MYDFIYQTVISLKYVGIALLMAIFPTEAVMPFVGYKASQGSLHFTLAVIVGTIGSTAGSTVVYLIARSLDPQSVDRFFAKYGRYLGLRSKQVEKAGTMFDRHQETAVFFGRFVPGVRTAVSVPAGFRHMNLAQFVLYTAMGSGFSSVGLALLGYYTTANIDALQEIATTLTFVVAGGIITVFLGILLARKQIRKRR